MQSLYSSRIPSRRIVRRGSEHSLLTCSMSIGPAESTPDKQKKSKTLEKPVKGKKRSKKSDTFSGRGTPTSSSVMNSPVRNSANLYFGSSPSHASLGVSASFSTADIQQKTPKKVSKWSKLSNIVVQKFSRAEGDDTRMRVKPQRSHSIPSIKKCGVYPVRNSSVPGEEMGMGGLAENGSISSINPRARKSSSSQANSVNLVAKIFSVLGCWVEEYFEVSEY